MRWQGAAGVLCWSDSQELEGQVRLSKSWGENKLGLEQTFSQINTHSLGSYFYIWIVYEYMHIRVLSVLTQTLLFFPWMQGGATLYSAGSGQFCMGRHPYFSGEFHLPGNLILFNSIVWFHTMMSPRVQEIGSWLRMRLQLWLGSELQRALELGSSFGVVPNEAKRPRLCIPVPASHPQATPWEACNLGHSSSLLPRADLSKRCHSESLQPVFLVARGWAH